MLVDDSETYNADDQVVHVSAGGTTSTNLNKVCRWTRPKVRLTVRGGTSIVVFGAWGGTSWCIQLIFPRVV